MKHSLVYHSKLIYGIYLNVGNSLAKITWYIVCCLLIGKKKNDSKWPRINNCSFPEFNIRSKQVCKNYLDTIQFKTMFLKMCLSGYIKKLFVITIVVE